MDLINACEWDAFLPAAMRSSSEQLLDELDELESSPALFLEDEVDPLSWADWASLDKQAGAIGRECKPLVEVEVPPPCFSGRGQMLSQHTKSANGHATPVAALAQPTSPSPRTVAVPPAPRSLGIRINWPSLAHPSSPASTAHGGRPFNSHSAKAFVPLPQFAASHKPPSATHLLSSGTCQALHVVRPDSSLSSAFSCNLASLPAINIPEAGHELTEHEKSLMLQLCSDSDGKAYPDESAAWPAHSGDRSCCSDNTCARTSTCVTTSINVLTCSTPSPCAGSPSASASVQCSPTAVAVERVCSNSGPLSELAATWEAANAEQRSQPPAPSNSMPVSKVETMPARTEGGVGAKPAAAAGTNRKRSRQDVATTHAALATATGMLRRPSKRMSCWNCGAHNTPQWRCGPDGPRTLCNACGVRYKKGLPLAYKEAEAKLQMQASLEADQSACVTTAPSSNDL